MRKIIMLYLIILGCGSFSELKEKKNYQITNKLEVSTPLEIKIDKFIKQYLVDYDTISFIDETSNYARSLNKTSYLKVKKYGFTPKKSKKLKGNFYFKYYEYTDSATCSMSFDLWLKNYGSMAVPIKRHEYIKVFSLIPNFSILSSKYIIILFFDCEVGDKKTESIKNDFKHFFLDESKIETLDCGCGGPIKWN